MPEEAIIGVEPDAAVIETRTAERDALEDQILERIHAGNDAEDEDAGDAPKRERDEHGRFKPKVEASETEEPSEPAEVAPTADPANSEDYRKALSALTRAKAKQTVLDKMDPDEIIEWGLELASEQAKQDGFRKEAQATKAKLETPKLEDLDIDLASISQPIADYLGDDAIEPVQELAKAILQHVQAQNAPIRESLLHQERTTARDRLSKQWSLDDDARWSQVLERRGEDANDYTNESEALTAACRHCFADEVISDYKAKLSKQHDARANGQTTTTSRGNAPPPAETADDLQNQLLDAIHEGDDNKKKAISRKMNRRIDPWEIMGSDVVIGAPKR